MKLHYLLFAILFLLLGHRPASSQEVRWEKTFGPATIRMDIAIDSADVLYAMGLPEFAMFPGWPSAESFNRSTDRGMTWSKSNSPRSWTMTLASDGANSLYLGLDGVIGIYHTTDGGATWSHLDGAGTEVFAIAIGPGGELFTGTRAGTVHRSTDRGLTWQADTLETPYPATTVGFAFADDGSILLATLYNGVFRSTDDGMTWSASSNGIDMTHSLEGYKVPIAKTPWGDIYAAYGTTLYRSIDNGKNWAKMGDTLAGYQITAIFGTRRGELFAGTAPNGGILHSTDRGLTWQQTAQDVMTVNETGNVNPINVTQMLVTRSGVIVAATDSAGLLRTTAPIAASLAPMPERDLLPLVGSISPNPTASNASMWIVLSTASHVHTELVDSYGRSVRSLADAMMSEGEHPLVIDVKSLAVGTYFCRIAIDGIFFIRPILVLR